MPLPVRVIPVIPLSPAKSPAAIEVSPLTVSVPVIPARCASVTCEQSDAAVTAATMASRTGGVRSQMPTDRVSAESTLPPMFRQSGRFQVAGKPYEAVTIVPPFSRSVSE
jgi:hypothetical protein